MKVIVAGSRSITDNNLIWRIIEEASFDITELVSGCARGVDQCAEGWAVANRIPIKKFIPDWDFHGRKAGILRNEEMAKYADALIAIWDGSSKGTDDMIKRASKHKLKTYMKIISSMDITEKY